MLTEVTTGAMSDAANIGLFKVVARALLTKKERFQIAKLSYGQLFLQASLKVARNSMLEIVPLGSKKCALVYDFNSSTIFKMYLGITLL